MFSPGSSDNSRQVVKHQNELQRGRRAKLAFCLHDKVPEVGISGRGKSSTGSRFERLLFVDTGLHSFRPVVGASTSQWNIHGGKGASLVVSRKGGEEERARLPISPSGPFQLVPAPKDRIISRGTLQITPFPSTLDSQVSSQWASEWRNHLKSRAAVSGS